MKTSPPGSVLNEPSSSGGVLCRVCEKMYDGAQHCGVEVCRACASFYKRSVLQRKTFVCRRGSGKCNLNTGRKECCQKCRFSKCVEAGLVLPESVMEFQGGSLGKFSDKSSCIVLLNNEARQLCNPQAFPVLYKFCYLYNRSTMNLIQYENTLRSAETKGGKLDFQGMRIRPLHHSVLGELYNYNYTVMKKLMQDAFPAYHSFDDNYQDEILLQLMFTSWDLESAYRSLRIFNDPDCKKLMWSETMYVDTERVAEHLGIDDSSRDSYDTKLLNDYIGHMVESYLKSTHAYLHKIKISDLEYMAIHALNYWDERLYADSEETSRIAEQQRQQLYRELHYYYRYILKIDNYVERIMNLKGLSVHLQTNLLNLRYHANFLKVFNYFSNTNDNALLNVLLQLPAPIQSITI